MSAILRLCLAMVVGVTTLGAQAEVTARVEGPSPSIVRLGGAARFEIQVSGAEADPQTPRLPKVDGLRFQIAAPFTQNYQSYTRGRVTRSRTVAWDVTVVPERVGEFEIPKFSIETGKGPRELGPLRLTCVADARGEELGFLRIRAESQRVYVHEPVRLTIDYGVRGDVDLMNQRARTQRGVETVYLVHLRASWLDELEGALPIDATQPGDSTEPDVALIVNDQIEHVRYDNTHRENGTPYHRFVLEHAWLPTRSGNLRIPRSVLGFRIPTGPQRRDIFGSPMQRDSEELFCYSEPLSIEVLPLPEEGRPADYTGAVGRFELKADATPRRVEVGESVKWTLTVEGRGNVEFLGLPRIDEVEGFHVLGRNENREDGRATLTLDLTPLSDTVSGLPAVDWSSFDTTPGVERYVALRAPAIPLEVRPLPEGAGLERLPGEAEPELVPGVDDVHDIFEVDLLRATPEAPPSPVDLPMRGLAVLGPWLAAVLLWAGLRVRSARRGDAAAVRARGARRDYQRARSAGRAADEALVVYLAARLDVEEAAVIGPDLAARLGAAGVDVLLAAEVADAIERGTTSRYGGGQPPDDAEVEGLVERLERFGWNGAARDSASAARLALQVLLLAVGAGAVPAQDVATGSVEAEAQAAYRQGDYPLAAAKWREASRAPDADPRLAYNLGNALFRQKAYAEALVAYERARPAMPRSPRLLANIDLCERRLEVGSDGSGEAFSEAVASLRDALTTTELLVWALVCNALAALGLVFGRGALRVAGAVVAVPALLLGLELLVLGPARPPEAIILAAPRARVVAEPREGLEPVATLRAGARVEVVGRGPEWTRVALPDREGYVRTGELGFPADG